MQKVAAYLLERRDDMTSPAARATETESLKDKIRAWLSEKQASGDGAHGEYVAEDGSAATFRIEEATHGDQSWWWVRLEEVTAAGRRFIASISVTSSWDRVAVYVTLELGSRTTLVNPVAADARCPKIVRDLLSMGGRWYHGATEILALRRIAGVDAGSDLADEIIHLSRTIPIVVLSRDEHGDIALSDLDENLAFDLAGIANVVVTDTDASWALTDELGKAHSCYSGAVRLYWPKFSTENDPYAHPLWTLEKLRAGLPSEGGLRDRFRRQLRSRVMDAAALSVVRPYEIDVIRQAATQKVFTDLHERARSREDFEALAKLYAEENDRLCKSEERLQAQLTDFRERLSAGEAERAILIARVENAELALRYMPERAEEIAPAPVAVDEEVGPVEGEFRFYKKVTSGPGRDVMRLVADCGCNNWQGAHAADKARKGILKFEKREEMNNMWHCASCTGGGMWRVRW